jgi:hypothetical protein
MQSVAPRLRSIVHLIGALHTRSCTSDVQREDDVRLCAGEELAAKNAGLLRKTCFDNMDRR